MATVTNTIKLPDGSTPSNAAVEIELVASTTTKAAGWVTATDVTLLSIARPAVTGGAWTASLTPNADITPSGTVYKVTEYADRHRYIHYISVGSGGGTVHDLLVDAPASLASAALTDHISDTSGAHAASAITVADSGGYYSATTVEAALAEAMQAARPALASTYFTGGQLYSHRMNYGVAPENTLEAARIAVNQGATCFETDVQLLADGSLGIMHDSTATRTTSSTAAMSTLTAASFKQLTIDVSSYFAPSWADTHPPLLSEIFDEFGGKIVLMIEPKTTSAIQPLIDEIVRRGLQASCAIDMEVSADMSWVATANAAGITTMLYWNVTSFSTVTVAQAVAAGPDILDVGFSYTDAEIAAVVSAAHAAGMKVSCHSLNRRYERDRMLGLGVDCMLVNDTKYLEDDSRMSTSGLLANGTPLNGLVHAATPGSGTVIHPRWAGSAGAYRLACTTSGGESNSIGYCLGHMSPIPASPTFTVTGRVTWDVVDPDSTRFAWVMLAQDDHFFNGGQYSNGYQVILRQSGVLNAYRITAGAYNSSTGLRGNGTATQIGGSSGSTAITATTAVPFTLQKSATGLVWTRTDTGDSLTVSDSTYAGPWYLHVGKTASTSAMAISFDNFSVA